MTMKKERILKMEIPKGWADYSNENPNGPATFLRELSSKPCVIQTSLTLYESGPAPNPSCEDLIEMTKELGENMSAGKLVETYSGECKLGKFGTSIFSSEEFPRTQIWYLSDGKNFILATHICTSTPEIEEVAEAQEIVKSLYIANENRGRLPN